MTSSDNVWQRATKPDKDPFLRNATAARRFLRSYRLLPYPVRMLGIVAIGFSLGSVVGLFAWQTGLFEAVIEKKDIRRHELDTFVVNFREDLLKWQQQDAERRKL
ncbi:hypothetical protein ERJ75_001329700 [Trypanosoma vivax]|uniref:Transmembrane protein n=1 Tax=Trypanosoma vivax (strain Y486) TaxID=1055687 RepID=G0TRN5_TRYVY|nr:hypothetical protein TRVL_02424 [Trypanosoma vivax]KAH8608139.1 hypothetical protein ERJ75_001329700 [Trypanosoma vivax]CCC46605.1 conserved hypothetical protein [Trypanosoma vivax Y486]